ncbi:hypothetical protein [Rhizosphaericola mali]|uniref:Uncharacterized protein n=1 Tax=Rhizosphaericola mali TaxID=2545455 RepID=A0A5P2G0G7_9BACT|nr:hypothetical protein [Rhizosphaericola mali]QES89296.1 hypothetical protein E0W69_011685 [Rhizosphaericola mali]
MLVICSCSKTTIDTQTYSTYKDYLSINVGDSYLYRLDSVALLSFGTDTVTRTYYRKDSVISASLDGENNTTYRIYTYLKPFTSSSNSWVYLNAYNITLDSTNLQLVDENNLRFIKLSNPITVEHSWDGDAYFTIGTSASSSFSDPADVYINYQSQWSYQYTDLNTAQTFYDQSYNNTITVNEIDYTEGSMSSYYTRLYSSESYAKGLGLIHRKFLFLNWQTSSDYSTYSYGIELTRIQ